MRSKSTIRTGRAIARASCVALVALVLAACLPEDSSETPVPHESDSPLTTPTPSPSASPNPSPSPSGPEPSGPITGAPAGTPVTPEIFMTTVDEAEGVLRVVVFVPGVYEDGGSCTVTVHGQSSTILEYQVGVADVSSTACGQFTFSLSQLGSGEATVTAGYESAKYSGDSETETVVIP